MTDPIADLLTRIRNGLHSGKKIIDMPSSNLKKRILFILKEEHYIENFILLNNPIKKKIRVFLKYDINGEPAIINIQRSSKPGRRVYVAANEIPRVLDGLGIAILTTSKGVISNKVAKKLNVGGEIICTVW
jgi:small subunit ribosomal protein S8|tara:strand:+ start:226 stop:618 length:393 start_codon:yes stop_codon:yes gene_type:complete